MVAAESFAGLVNRLLGFLNPALLFLLAQALGLGGFLYSLLTLFDLASLLIYLLLAQGFFPFFRNLSFLLLQLFLLLLENLALTLIRLEFLLSFLLFNLPALLIKLALALGLSLLSHQFLLHLFQILPFLLLGSLELGLHGLLVLALHCFKLSGLGFLRLAQECLLLICMVSGALIDCFCDFGVKFSLQRCLLLFLLALKLLDLPLLLGRLHDKILQLPRCLVLLAFGLHQLTRFLAFCVV